MVKIKYIIVIVLGLYLGYGEHLVHKIDDILILEGYVYAEYRDQGLGELGRTTRVGLYSDYLTFRMRHR